MWGSLSTKHGLSLIHILITGEIKRFLRDDGMIKVSRSIKEMGIRVRAAREEMTYSLGREPTIEEIARHLDTSREEVAASLEAGAEVESLFRPAGNGDDNTTVLMDRLEEEHDSHEELLNHLVLKELMEEMCIRDRENEDIEAKMAEVQEQLDTLTTGNTSIIAQYQSLIWVLQSYRTGDMVSAAKTFAAVSYTHLDVYKRQIMC